MARYKRNQVENAISSVLDPSSNAPSSEMRSRQKRLLEADRALGRVRRSTDPVRANYAFYSEDAQGSGVEVWFSTYEAFALLTALRLIGHGWTPSRAINVMRQVRPELEKEFTRILNQDSKALFDQEAIRRKARAGEMAVDNTGPVFLVIVSGRDSKDGDDEFLNSSIRRGPNSAVKWGFDASRGAGGYTMFELVTSAHVLLDKLAHAEPRFRGRGS